MGSRTGSSNSCSEYRGQGRGILSASGIIFTYTPCRELIRMLVRPYRGNLPAGFPVCSKIMQDARGNISCEDGGRYDKMPFF